MTPPACPDCVFCEGTPARLVCTKPGGLSAPGVATSCALFVARQPAPADPLTPAERAELLAYEQRHPMALMDAGQLARWEALRRKAGLV